MGMIESVIGNEECGKSKTKHETPKTIVTFNPKSAIRNPKSKIERPDT